MYRTSSLFIAGAMSQFAGSWEKSYSENNCSVLFLSSRVLRSLYSRKIEKELDKLLTLRADCKRNSWKNVFLGQNHLKRFSSLRRMVMWRAGRFLSFGLLLLV